MPPLFSFPKGRLKGDYRMEGTWGPESPPGGELTIAWEQLPRTVKGGREKLALPLSYGTIWSRLVAAARLTLTWPHQSAKPYSESLSISWLPRPLALQYFSQFCNISWTQELTDQIDPKGWSPAVAPLLLGPELNSQLWGPGPHSFIPGSFKWVESPICFIGWHRKMSWPQMNFMYFYKHNISCHCLIWDVLGIY